MCRADEDALAWSLVDAFKAILPSDFMAWTCARIGADDHEHAIGDLLRKVADRDIALLAEFTEPLTPWARGYRGSDSEPYLRELLTRLCAGDPDLSTRGDPTLEPRSFDGRPRRVRSSIDSAVR